MERFFKRKSDSVPKNISVGVEINLVDLPSDLGLRKSISNYDPKIRDQIRKEYL